MVKPKPYLTPKGKAPRTVNTHNRKRKSTKTRAKRSRRRISFKDSTTSDGTDVPQDESQKEENPINDEHPNNQNRNLNILSKAASDLGMTVITGENETETEEKGSQKGK